jgi:hypothetical protein
MFAHLTTIELKNEIRQLKNLVREREFQIATAKSESLIGRWTDLLAFEKDRLSAREMALSKRKDNSTDLASSATGRGVS